MNALVLLLIGFACLIAGYVVYGSWLEKQWGVDPNRETPAHTMYDGVDYVPAKAPVLLGHHFSSIAGAGPINGPIQAAIFGWLPCLLWILIGGIFFGAAHDYGSLVASVRHKGESIGEVIAQNIGTRAKRLFIIFAYLALLLVIAAFASIVAGTFNGFDANGNTIEANGSTATISILFILMAIVFGFCVYRKNYSLSVCTVVGVIALVLCIAAGLAFPVYLPGHTWMYIIGLYIMIASVTPVWILLQPRDYLSSFLLYAMMIAAVVGVFACHPTLSLPAFVGFETHGQYLFPALFVTIACGAISGFHSLIASGTTSKQLSSEKDAKLIGYGAMLIECALAIVSLIAISYIYSESGDAAFKIPPTAVFASGISKMLAAVGLDSPEAQKTTYGLMILAVSAFCLTSLDTAARMSRYLFTEFWLNPGETVDSVTGFRKVLCNKYVGTFISVVLGVGFGLGGWAKVWPLFGASNQLLAGLALLAIAAWLKNASRNHKMLVFPMAFMILVTLTSLFLTFIGKIQTISAGQGDLTAAYLQAGLSAILFVLALFLVREALPVLRKKA
ncbi:carbon starvation protein A [uncultured Mailhella sp.]|uniref:carbon starvation CstA family protein n=1 Tax=uncultured Mailhella sp. TaxID=1981031 RepID=UPI0026064EB2|nr:carbon starvation protein A [uncultured Mailhella sp.]